MDIDWGNFTPRSALAGGALIGLGAGLLVLLLGKIAGVSGVLAGLVPPKPADAAWRVAFLLGLFVAPALAGLVHDAARPRFDAGYPTLVISGLLVGFGARLGGGCTSGHGVCGLSRLSLRSAVATGAFMAAAIGTVYVQRHIGN